MLTQLGFRVQDFESCTRFARAARIARLTNSESGYQRGLNRVVSFAIFERGNMQGAAVTQQNHNAACKPTGERICAAPCDGARLN